MVILIKVFDEWNKTELDSFLIEITANILKYKENGEPLLPRIKDSAGQVKFKKKSFKNITSDWVF